MKKKSIPAATNKNRTGSGSFDVEVINMYSATISTITAAVIKVDMAGILQT